MINEYIEKNETEDENFTNVLPNNISGLWKALKIVNSNKQYYNSLIQWDDAWLLTILKNYYFNNINSEIKNYKLEEFLSNNKKFYSIIKDSSDFVKLDNVVKNNLTIIIDEDFDENYVLLLKNICKKCNNKEQNLSEGFLLHDIKVFIESYFFDKYNFKSIIEETIKNIIEGDNNFEIKEYFTVFKETNYGLNKIPNILDSNKVISLNNISNIDKVLHYDGMNFPLFFIFIRINEDKAFNYTEFINYLGKNIGLEFQKFFDIIINKK